MLTDITFLVKKNSYPGFFGFSEKNSVLAKLLYNAALFRIRQTFTGWDKDARTDNEQEVFDEIAVAQKACTSMKVRRVLSYKALDRIMRANSNPDFFAGLPMQTAQAVLKQAVHDFRVWLNQLKDYRKHPSKYTGKPGMPKYKKSDRDTFIVTNQDAVLYPVTDKNGAVIDGQKRLKLPGVKKNNHPILHGFTNNGVLKEMTIKPYYGHYMVSLVMETPDAAVSSCGSEMAGLDFGTDNIAALACTDGSSVVFKGGAVLSENRWFAKKKADAVSDITKGHKRMHAESAYLDRLSLHHSFRNRNFMHQCSRRIIDWCTDHKVSVLVIGRNKGWKQKTNMGKASNQKFVSVPHYQLLQLIEYKAALAGIQIIEQEESYTSRADISAMDHIPVYGSRECRNAVAFSGYRVKRGLYRTHEGYVINADCNGAANILRKSIPDAWKGRTDFRFLGFPKSISCKKIIGAAS